MKHKRWIIGLIIALTLAGMGVSLYLTRLHYALMIPGQSVESICNINAVVNCVSVNASAYAEIKGIPVAGLGFVYYTIAFVFTLWGAWICRIHFKKSGAIDTPPPCNPIFFFLFFFSIPALLMTAYMIYASFQLLAVCLFCIAMYVINVLLFVLFPKAANVPWRGMGPFLEAYFLAPGHFVKMSMITLLLLLVGVGVLADITHTYQTRRDQAVAWQKRRAMGGQDPRHTPESIRDILAIFDKQPVASIEIPDDRPRWGGKAAPLQVVEFIDFQCPACKQAAELIPEFLNTHYANQFSLVQLNFPLDQSCNPNIKRKMHPFACDAAKIGVCVDQNTDAFWEYSEAVFANQGKITPGQLRDWAKEAGISEEALNQCLVSGEADDRISGDIAIGLKVPVDGTPAVLLNGRNLQSLWRDPVLFKRVLDAELERAGKE